jgi:hypothetical protein
MKPVELGVRVTALMRDGRSVSLRIMDDDRLVVLSRIAELEAESASITTGLDAMLNRPHDVAGWEASSTGDTPDDDQFLLPERADDVDGRWRAVMVAGSCLEVPMWWAETPACPHPRGCGCGPVSLGEAIQGATGSDKRRLAEAHMGLLAELSRHYDAVLALLSGEVLDDVCVGCLAQPELHLETLQHAITDTAHDLAHAFADGQLGVRA